MLALAKRYTRYQEWTGKVTWLRHYADRLGWDTVLTKAADEMRLSELLGVVYMTLVTEDHSGKKRYGEKTPLHIYYSPWVRRLFKKSRFITLIRSPISNIANLCKRGRDLNEAIDRYLSWFSPELRELYEPGESLVVRYEDLLHDPEGTLNKVHDYLGASDEEVTGQFSYYTKEFNIGREIDPERDEKARALLDDGEKDLIRECCASVFSRFYPDEA